MEEVNNEKLVWSIIDKYFTDNPESFVSHHLESYNDFFGSGLQRIFKEKNPIKIRKDQDPKTHEFNIQCNIFLGGKDGTKIYYGKPIIYDENRDHFMFPNEARLRNMSYGITIHYDVEVEFILTSSLDQVKTETVKFFPKIFLGRFPIMLQSDLCILKGLDRMARFELGECKNDYGGYFIIDGKEKCIISQEKFGDNMLYVRDMGNDLYSHSAEIRSVSEDASKPTRTLAVRIVSPTTTLTNQQIVVSVPNVRKPVPLFILMRALGVESDKEIIEYCLLDLKKNANYIDLFIPSIHDAGHIFTQEIALKYIATMTKGKTIAHTLEVLSDYFLPHMGEMNFNEKAYFIGYMVNQLLRVYMKNEKATDRDSFLFKRIETSGELIYGLFKEYYSLQQREIYRKIDKKYYFHQGAFQNDFIGNISINMKEFFADRVVEKGFRKAFKGNWGSEEHTKRIGVVQTLNRLSYNSFLSQLRKTSLPLDSSAKLFGPRYLHSSQWGIIDPLDTPDGDYVGLHKHMSIVARITTGSSGVPIIKWLRKQCQMRLLSECSPYYISSMCRVMVNGRWAGVIASPVFTVSLFKDYRRSALIPIFFSIQWDIANNTIFIYTDGGRLCRPIFYIEDGTPSYQKKHILESLEKGNYSWLQLITGFAAKKENAGFNYNSGKIYDTVAELYSANDLNDLKESKAIIEYLDTSETETTLIAINMDSAYKREKPYTHMEIHPSLLLGIMGNQIVLPENNQLPREVFSCGQAKQAVSLYHTNFPTRIDKMGVILNYGQVPLVKTRYLEYINKEQNPCGENTIVAIMCFNGYNVEDSILFNEGAIKRGLFRTTYFSMYESHEENSKVGDTQINSHFANIESEVGVVGLKPGFDYSELDEYGLIRENTPLDDKKVVIGKVVSNLAKPGESIDASSFPKKGQTGFVDKTFITEGEQGFRIAKVRVRDERSPSIGDKFASRCGQKGTVGIIIPEEDMPFTADGIRPDIIINPHAIPSRMTIGQLIESLMGKACGLYGAFGDCTAFVNNGSKHEIFGKVLTDMGYHSSGTEILYNGQTGEQVESNIYIGPTYYMRLKHMVKDKINYRAQGPRTVLTRQTVQGRANDGGLRVGEMERDCLISHGITNFLQESMLTRGDEYFMAVCNKSGTIAIYNESYNLFMSPFVDGPIKFKGTVSADLNIENVSKHGRDFSVLRIPYAFKLLMQELQTMNIQMRIITDDNIDQMTTMTFSNNIDKLTGKSIDLNLKESAIDVSQAGEEEEEVELPSTIVRDEPVGYKSFNKLVATEFLKFKLPSGLPVPSVLDTVESIEINPEDPYMVIDKKVANASKPLDSLSKPDYMYYSDILDLYNGLKRKFIQNYGFPFATNAALKMYEMIYEMKLIDCSKDVNVFCDAELPGAFIVSINHYIKTICQSKPNFDWVGSSYYPAAAAKVGDITILGDNYGLYEKNRQNWLMGPAPNALAPGQENTTGDLTSVKELNTLVDAIHVRFSTGATLATGDAGIDVSEDYSKQESMTALLNYGQILAAILSLAPGGHLMTKQFMFNYPFSRSVIALVGFLFEEAYITKPLTSRPANSEVYIVGKNFKGISKEMTTSLLDRLASYASNGISPCDGSPLFDPATYKEIDAVILQAAEKIHGDQQVSFLREIETVIKRKPKIVPADTEQVKERVEKVWLSSFPILKIRPEDSLPNKKQNQRYQYQHSQNQQKTMPATVKPFYAETPIIVEDETPIIVEEEPAIIDEGAAAVLTLVKKSETDLPVKSILTDIAEEEKEGDEEERGEIKTKSVKL